MSFKLIFKRAVHVLEEADTGLNDAEQFLEPILEKAYPLSTPAFALFDRMQTAIQAAERLVTAPDSGAVKASLVDQDFNASLVTAQNVLLLRGKQLTYDMVLQAAARDAQVAAYNAMAALYSSFKVIDTPPTAPA
jgi:hypothetical protein